MNTPKQTVKVLTTTHVEAMCKAIEETKAFTISRTTNIITATHNASGYLALQALNLGEGLWSIRHAEDLFV